MRDNAIDARLKAAMNIGDLPEPQGDLSDLSALHTRKASVMAPQSRTKLLGGGVALLALAITVPLGVSAITQPPPPLFALAGGGSGLGAEAGGAAESSQLMGDSVTDRSFFIDTEYQVGPGLSSDGGRGGVYQVLLSGTPESVLAMVSSAFGLAGTSRESEYSDATMPLYVVGPDDGTGASANLSWSGTGQWSYYNSEVYPAPVCETVDEISEEGTVFSYDDCQFPDPLGTPPSVDAAKEQAAALFAQTGLTVAAVDVQVLWQDDLNLSLFASIQVEGMNTALEWTLSYAGSRISSASGHSVELVEKGQFDTVSPVAAVERIDSGLWWGLASSEFYLGAVASTFPAPVGGEGDVPETQVLVVTDARKTLLTVWDGAGNAWLVPGFVMNPRDGWYVSTISLIEGVIELPEPIPSEFLRDELAPTPVN